MRGFEKVGLEAGPGKGRTTSEALEGGLIDSDSSLRRYSR